VEDHRWTVLELTWVHSGSDSGHLGGAVAAAGQRRRLAGNTDGCSASAGG